MSLFCLYKLTVEKTGNQGITPEYAVVTSEMGKRVPAQKFTHVMLTSCFHQKDFLEKRKNRVVLHRAVYMTWCRPLGTKWKRRHLPCKKNLQQTRLFLKPNLTLQRGNSSSREKLHSTREHIILHQLLPQMVWETGLPTKEVFQIVVNYASRFKDSLSYYAGWRVESIIFEDQILITLMKLRQNCTNLHIAQLFSCSVATISNVVTTFIHVLHNILFDDLMTTIPSREKNKLCSPSSFSMFTSCRIVIDCTDIEVAAPSLMSEQNVTYSSYLGMNSFKVLVGMAPDAVINVCK